MSVHLVGGGRDLDAADAVYGRFVAEASRRALSAGRAIPVVAVVVVAEQDDVDADVGWFADALGRCGEVRIEPLTAAETAVLAGAPLRLPAGQGLEDARFSGLDGVLVGGGLTPAYHRLLQPYAGELSSAVSGGLPYLGFSAGAMIAGRHALLGGWRLGPVAVTHEDNAEDLDQVTVEPGLGLVPGSIEVHTAQWGTLSRMVAAVDAGATDQGIAVDENTVVIMDPTTDTSPSPMEVRGAGQAWLVAPGEHAVRVERRPAGG